MGFFAWQLPLGVEEKAYFQVSVLFPQLSLVSFQIFLFKIVLGNGAQFSHLCLVMVVFFTC